MRVQVSGAEVRVRFGVALQAVDSDARRCLRLVKAGGIDLQGRAWDCAGTDLGIDDRLSMWGMTIRTDGG